ncbi:MAG: hypothetical protein AAFY71_01230 [Bacteroidota bacterium]
MDILQQLPAANPIHADLALAQGSKTSFAVAKGNSKEALDMIKGIEEQQLALFVPADWLIIRDQLEQDWTINLPKGKGQETLYSTTFFWNPASDDIMAALAHAGQKEWAVYTQIGDKLCMLVINSKVGVDVKAEEVLGQLL